MLLVDVQHQERAVSILRRTQRSGRTPHAYLFSGPEGVGKELAARAVAARLLCEADAPPDADACGECTSCKLFTAGSHADFHVIDRSLRRFHPERTVRESKGLFLVVDLIRHFLIEPAGNAPSRGRARVFLLREAERMNEEAQNALLKTLEEPPGRAKLLLVTASAARLLPTIRSRCQVVPFDSLPAKFVEEQLAARWKAAPLEAATLARLSDGRLGVAREWQRMGLLKAVDTLAAALVEGEPDDPERFAKHLLELAVELEERAKANDEPAADDGNDENEGGDEDGASEGGGSRGAVKVDRDLLKLLFMLVAALHRDALAAAAGGDEKLSMLPGAARATGALAGRHSTESLDRCISAAAEAETMLDRNVAPQLTCERLGIVLSGVLV